MSLWRALTRSRAATRPDSSDPRLCGRSYPVPFITVWDAVLATAALSRRWTVVDADPQRGEVHAEAQTALWKFTDDVTILVSLAEDGLTRVDMQSASRVGRADLGTNARRIARFLHALDRRLGVLQPMTGVRPGGSSPD
jgi:hypothetical protein